MVSRWKEANGHVDRNAERFVLRRNHDDKRYKKTQSVGRQIIEGTQFTPSASHFGILSGCGNRDSPAALHKTKNKDKRGKKFTHLFGGPGGAARTFFQLLISPVMCHFGRRSARLVNFWLWLLHNWRRARRACVSGQFDFIGFVARRMRTSSLLLIRRPIRRTADPQRSTRSDENAPRSARTNPISRSMPSSRLGFPSLVLTSKLEIENAVYKNKIISRLANIQYFYSILAHLILFVNLLDFVSIVRRTRKAEGLRNFIICSVRSTEMAIDQRGRQNTRPVSRFSNANALSVVGFRELHHFDCAPLR